MTQVIHNKDTVKKELADYSPKMRAVEVVSIIIFVLLFTHLQITSLKSQYFSAGIFTLAIFTGFLAADFMSGLIHWFADTWGSVKWPVVGNSLIRSFREHHVDQQAITRHDFIETNGASALVVLPILIFCEYTRAGSTSVLFLFSAFQWLCFFSVLTNQFHKWAHSSKTSKFVNFLQEHSIILSKQHHSQHHRGDFDQHYCITTGWLNPILNKISFFRKLEKIISTATGAIARAEDLEFKQISRSEKT